MNEDRTTGRGSTSAAFLISYAVFIGSFYLLVIVCMPLKAKESFSESRGKLRFSRGEM